jgi:hypothetical protein
VDAAITSGRYTRERLLELAAEADHGFDRLLFADALGALTQITDAEAASDQRLSALVQAASSRSSVLAISSPQTSPSSMSRRLSAGKREQS